MVLLADWQAKTFEDQNSLLARTPSEALVVGTTKSADALATNPEAILPLRFLWRLIQLLIGCSRSQA